MSEIKQATAKTYPPTESLRPLEEWSQIIEKVHDKDDVVYDGIKDTTAYISDSSRRIFIVGDESKISFILSMLFSRATVAQAVVDVLGHTYALYSCSSKAYKKLTKSEK